MLPVSLLKAKQAVQPRLRGQTPQLLAVGGRPDSLILDLLEWKTPKPIGRPLVEANHLGLFRMAFMVDDARGSCAELDRLGVPHSGTCHLDMGPDVPIEGGLYAVFFRDPDGTCLELIETPQVQRASGSR